MIDYKNEMIKASMGWKKVVVDGVEREIYDSEWTVFIDGRSDMVCVAMLVDIDRVAIGPYLSKDGIKMLHIVEDNGNTIDVEYSKCKIFDSYGSRKGYKEEAFKKLA